MGIFWRYLRLRSPLILEHTTHGDRRSQHASVPVEASNTAEKVDAISLCYLLSDSKNGSHQIR